MGMTARLQILGLIGVVLTRMVSAEMFNCSNYFKLGYVQEVNASTLYPKTITSPNYPFPYNTLTFCEWMITYYDPGYVLKVVFNDFDLEDGQLTGDDRCLNADFLNFEDGTISGSETLGTYCGSNYPEVFYSARHFLHVEFYSNSGDVGTYRGFNFSFLAVKKEEASAICRFPWVGPSISGNIVSLHGFSGTFFTPDYPVPYRHQESCVWKITAPAFKRVKLTFETFELTTTFLDCDEDGNDYVEVRDGLTSNNYEIATLCKYNTPNLPPPVYSTGRTMYVNFRAFGPDQRKDGKGFKAHFQAVDQPADINSTEVCFPGNINNNNLRLTGKEGSLKSPLDLYPPDINCTWIITVPEGNIVELLLIGVHLDGPGDYVELLDGRYGSARSLVKILDEHIGTFRSSGRHMTVFFRSDSDDYHRYPGFKATFKAVRDTESKKILMAICISSGVIVLIIICFVCIAKREKSANREISDDSIPMTTVRTSASNATQPHPPPPQVPFRSVDHPYATPPVGYAAVPTNPPTAPPAYPESPPPPYPEVEGIPQYPPPGQSYPWLQNNTPVQT